MPAVDEEVLQIGPRTRSFGLAGQAAQRQRPAFGLQRPAGGDEVFAQHIGPALRGRSGAPLRDQTVVMPHSKTHIGPCQRVAPHGLQRMCEFGGVGLHELAPRRGAEEEFVHLHRGAGAARSGRQLTAACLQTPGVRCASGARGECHLGHRGNGRQGLATKAHRGHRFQFSQRLDLAGGVALQRQRQVFAGNAAAVVFHHDGAHAAGHQAHSNLRRASVQCVVYQFTHHRSRAFDDFARSDLAHQFVRQFADASRRMRRHRHSGVITEPQC